MPRIINFVRPFVLAPPLAHLSYLIPGQRLIKHLFPNTNARIQGYQQALDELLQELLHGAELTTSLAVQRIWDEVQDIQDFGTFSCIPDL